MKVTARFLLMMFVLLIGTTAYSAEQRITVPLGDSPRMGPDNAPVTIVEFIDFQ
jgi:hypothetical protein